MKNLVFYFVLFAMGFNLTAQNWSIGAHWIYETTSDPWSEPTYVTFTKEGDTLVQGRVCSVIVEKGAAIDSQNLVVEHPYALHILWQDGSRVWAFDKGKAEFFPLYDFSKNAGDTLDMFILHKWDQNGSSTIKVRIDSVTQAQVGAQTLKIQWVTNITPDLHTEMHGPIYENIGWVRYLFPRPGFVDPPPGGWLQCFSDSSLAFPTNVPCVLTVGANEISENNFVKIYPNPATDVLFMDADNIQTIKVFDVLGSLVESQIGATQVSIGHLPDGIYFMAVCIGGRDFFKK